MTVAKACDASVRGRRAHEEHRNQIAVVDDAVARRHFLIEVPGRATPFQSSAELGQCIGETQPNEPGMFFLDCAIGIT